MVDGECTGGQRERGAAARSLGGRDRRFATQGWAPSRLDSGVESTALSPELA